MTECICANKELVASCVHPYCPEHGYDEDKERASRVGEAVIEVVGSGPIAPDGLDVMAHNMGAANEFLPALLRAIAEALRGGS